MRILKTKERAYLQERGQKRHFEGSTARSKTKSEAVSSVPPHDALETESSYNLAGNLIASRAGNGLVA